MIAALSAFLLVAFLPQLLPPWLLLSLFLCALVFLRLKYPVAKQLAIFICALCWASGYGHWQMAHRLAVELEGVPLSLTVQVVGLPQRNGERCSYDALPQPSGWSEALARAGVASRLAPPRRVRLNDYNCAVLPQPGEEWRLHVRLKRPHGYRNPRGYDRELTLLREGVDATGSVLRRPSPGRISGKHGVPVDRLRWRLTESIQGLLGDSAGMASALLLGDKRGLSDSQWQLLRDSGTLHLFVVSGMHIGAVAMALYALVLAAMRLAGSNRLLLRQWVALIVALSGAVLYAAMAGWAIPTQRAMLMVAALMLGWISSRQLSYPRRLGWAALLVLLVDPLAVRSIGFWLSFAAAAILLYAFACRPQTHAVRRLVYAQVAIFVGLAPWLISGFSQVALLAPIINLVAIPWVTLVVLPMLLLGALLLPLSSTMAAPLLQIAAQGLTLFEQLLIELQPWLLTLNLSAPSAWAIPLAVMGCALLLAPRALPGRWLAIPLLLPLFWPQPERLRAGEYSVTVFDVGQGSAILVETRSHRLLYDSGPRYPSGFVVADMTLLPYLQGKGITRLDLLVASHGDSDHTGGHERVAAQLQVADRLSGEPLRSPGRPCVEGDEWLWDGVRFRVLHPGKEGAYQGNNSSCVLQIASAAGRTLLTGDIEVPVESRLVERYGAALQADLLMASHHGSQGASSPAFVETIRPRVVLFSSGYRNRYGHPAAQVIKRFEERGSEVYRTDQSGAQRWRFSAQGMQVWPLWAVWQKGFWRSG